MNADVFGIKATKVYHLEDCREMDGTSKRKRIRFAWPSRANEAGYTPCPTCLFTRVDPPDNLLDLSNVEDIYGDKVLGSTPAYHCPKTNTLVSSWTCQNECSEYVIELHDYDMEPMLVCWLGDKRDGPKV